MNKTSNLTFGEAIEAIKQGCVAFREGWAGKGLFVFRQVPSEVPVEVIPRMTSLPAVVKSIAEMRGTPLRYSNQLAILFPDNTVNGWAPSVSDALASDWSIRIHAVAVDTVGSAISTE